MLLSSFLWYTIVALCSLIPIYYFKSYLRKSFLIMNLPGPPALPLLGNMLMFARLDAFQHVGRELLKKYPNVCRIWFCVYPVVILTAASEVQIVLGSRKYITKSFFYNILRPLFGDGLITNTGTKWHVHRKLVTPTFHFNILTNYVNVFTKKSEELVDNLQPLLASERFDLCPIIHRCMMSIMYESGIGHPVKEQEGTKYHIPTALCRVEEIMMDRMLKPWLFSDWLFNLTPNGRRQRKYLNMINEFLMRVIKENKEAIARGKNNNSIKTEDAKKDKIFLDLLIEASEDGLSLTDEEIRDELLVFINGESTAATSISFCLYTLGLHPDVQDKIVEETEDILGPTTKYPSIGDLKAMSYLDRCMKECHRLYPCLPLIARKLPEDVKIGDCVIPAGSDVVMPPFMVHRHPGNFSNPEVFNPDNFLPEAIQTRHPYAYIPFSAGPRNCIATKFMSLVEKAIVSSILRRYRLESLEKPEELILLPNVVLMSKNGLQVRISPR